MARPKSVVKQTMAPAKKLDFANTIQYEARKGYAPPDKDNSSHVLLRWTKSSPSIQFSTNLPLPSDCESESNLSSPV
jgi:hypothetical protein